MLDAITDQRAAVHTTSEAARALGISGSYVHKLLRQGKARRTVRTFGGRRLFSAEDVRAMAEAIGRADKLWEEA